MNPVQWLVLCVAVAAIAAVNWYFFAGHGPAAEAHTVPGGAQETAMPRGNSEVEG